MYVLSTGGGHKRVSDPLELETKMVVSHNWCAGIWTQVPCKNNHCGISLQTQDSFMRFPSGWNIQKAMENYPIVIQDLSHRYSSLCFALSCNTTSCFSPSSFSLSSEIGPHYVTQDGLKFRASEFSSAKNTSVSLPSTVLPLQSITVWLHFPTVLP